MLAHADSGFPKPYIGQVGLVCLDPLMSHDTCDTIVRGLLLGGVTVFPVVGVKGNPGDCRPGVT